MKKCIKCKKPFPEDTKRVLCEHCAGMAVDGIKNAAKVAAGVGSLVIAVVTMAKNSKE